MSCPAGRSAIERLEFPGASGSSLAARLDRPAGASRGFALFAHCFTCGKDLSAAAAIAGALNEQGVAVLRFDFTGLGSSEGEFANTDFSSNVDDLVAAADHLREHYLGPRLLIGHSLGGSAVLAAAGRIARSARSQRSAHLLTRPTSNICLASRRQRSRAPARPRSSSPGDGSSFVASSWRISARRCCCRPSPS